MEYESVCLAKSFGDKMKVVINDLLGPDLVRLRNKSAPFTFSENNLRSYFKEKSDILNVGDPALRLEIEKVIKDDYKTLTKSHGGTDYFYVSEFSDTYDSSMVRATFEVKGPIRPSLLMGSRKNWYPLIVADVRKQAWRSLNFFNCENYIVLLFKPVRKLNTDELIESFYVDIENSCDNVKLMERYREEIALTTQSLYVSIVLVSSTTKVT